MTTSHDPYRGTSAPGPGPRTPEVDEIEGTPAPDADTSGSHHAHAEAPAAAAGGDDAGQPTNDAEPVEPPATGGTPDESTEVPWFDAPPPAHLAMQGGSPDIDGYLHFVDPNGDRAAVPVSYGEGRAAGEGFNPVWHLELDEGGAVATVSPSIHYVGAWHSPSPVQFLLVGELTPPT